MGKKHLPKPLIKRFLPLQTKIYLYIFQRKPLQCFAPCLLYVKGNQGRRRFFYRMSSFRCHTVTSPIGTSGWIRKPSCCQDNGIPIFFQPVCQPHAFDAAFLDYQPFYLRFQPDIHLSFFQLPSQSSYHIRRMVRNRKYPASPFYFHRASRLFKPIHHRPVIEPIKGTV